MRIVIGLLAWVAFARAQTIFPADSRPPESSDAAMLEAVCPGAADAARMRCNVPCPGFTDFHGDRMEWSLKAITLGHFLSPASDDAVLAMSGCESHASNFGGTLVLTRRGGKWTPGGYRQAVLTDQCHKVTLRTSREILVCIGTFGGQGNFVTHLSVVDLARAEEPESFFSAFDDTETCQWRTETAPHTGATVRSRIDKVQFLPLRPGLEAPVVTVLASFGSRPVTPASDRACKSNPSANLPALKSYRAQFVYGASDYRPMPASAGVVRMFALKR